MRVIRYSFDGFKPQKQTFHMERHVDFHLYHFEEWYEKEHVETKYAHIASFVLEKHKMLVPFYRENYHDFEEGVWVFWEGHKNSIELNHLKRPTPCWSAILPDDIEVYDINLEKKTILSDPLVSHGCYVPKRSLVNISNIQQVARKKKVA